MTNAQSSATKSAKYGIDGFRGLCNLVIITTVPIVIGIFGLYQTTFIREDATPKFL